LPGYNVDDITPSSLLTAESKGLSPVIWNANCDAGKFDAPQATQFPNVFPINFRGVSMSEKWLEADAAVGSFAASRESSVWWGRIDLEKMAQAVFPEQGNIWRTVLNLPTVQPVLQLGAILATVDANVIAQGDMVHDHGAQGAIFEYNLMGDPSLSMRRDRPNPLGTLRFNAVLQNVSDVLVSTTTRANGATVTLVKDGQYIGRGVIVNGMADVSTVVTLPDLTGVEAIVAGDKFVPTSRTFPAP
jgi:hypothetical protein